LGARGFIVRDVVEVGDELVVAIETTTEVLVGCASCGTRARAKDRRRVRLRDVPIGGRGVQLEWHKRVWSCPKPECETNTWTEQRCDVAGARRVLSMRAAQWVCDRVAAIEGTPASCARTLGVSWSTVWAAVVEYGTPQVDAAGRVGVTAMVGFDETVMQPAQSYDPQWDPS
jgi:transposase